MIIPQSDIEKYIPQREPFIMIDNLLSASVEQFESNFVVDASNIFLKDNRLTSYALIENIAQTCAAGLTITSTGSSDKFTDGFLASISGLEIFMMPEVEEQIHTVALKKMAFHNMYSFFGQCFRGNKLLMKCDIKIVGISK